MTRTFLPRYRPLSGPRPVMSWKSGTPSPRGTGTAPVPTDLAAPWVPPHERDLCLVKTWLITGCSTGFGRELARAVLAEPDSTA
ncbi:hypothetical protein GCM10023195_06660 [Actinoallomurus liliacearum]|uniref:Uncharacterized protein n=1 Tax=Actinoallomurus liliacearum TaxID=1080073 RepID=A0ABP8TCH7_9ACTN